MTETVLKRQFITDSDGTPVGVILPIEEFALVQDLLEREFPSGETVPPKVRSELNTRSIRDAEFFGMWADRQDMADRSSRDWLNDQRASHWSRP
jgi:hypothetical protein